MVCFKQSFCLISMAFPVEMFPQRLNEGSDLLLKRTLEAPSVHRQLPGSGLFGLPPRGPPRRVGRILGSKHGSNGGMVPINQADFSS